MSYCNRRLVFQTKSKFSNFFKFEKTIPSFLCSDIAYQFQCGDSIITYYNETKYQFKVIKVRMCDHINFGSTDKRFKDNDDFAIK